MPNGRPGAPCSTDNDCFQMPFRITGCCRGVCASYKSKTEYLRNCVPNQGSCFCRPGYKARYDRNGGWVCCTWPNQRHCEPCHNSTAKPRPTPIASQPASRQPVTRHAATKPAAQFPQMPRAAPVPVSPFQHPAFRMVSNALPR